MSGTVFSCMSFCHSTTQAVNTIFASAKMEAQENDLPASVGFKVSGFPTLKFKQAGSREFIDYDGDRSLESLIEFVEANAKNSLERKARPPTENETTQEEVHDEL
jgi:protein disulfide-isomerase A1